MKDESPRSQDKDKGQQKESPLPSFIYEQLASSLQLFYGLISHVALLTPMRFSKYWVLIFAILVSHVNRVPRIAPFNGNGFDFLQETANLVFGQLPPHGPGSASGPVASPAALFYFSFEY